ncbi:heat shock protein [Colletotrichum sojae]|uniref:Heat shock protein n=1 Tax=Colletotrichum sojae TaxID=2175907 RepID=A0A8H6JR41_9PEZI|nr:heat shock protein [Colletotrichum sojae]
MIRRSDRGLDLWASLALMLSSVSAWQCSIEHPNTFGITLGRSHSTVSIAHQGAIRIPIASQTRTPISPDPSDEPELFLTGQEASLQSALFDTNWMVCRQSEPEYLLTHTIPSPLSPSSFNDSLAPVLQHLRAVAGTWFGEHSQNAVVTVPHDWYVDDAIQEAINSAASSIGLDVVRILRSHAAAALGHKLEQEPMDKEKVLVYELDHDNFETTVIDVDYGVFDPLQSSRSASLGSEITSRIQRGDTSSPALETLFQKTTTHVEKILTEANLTTSDVVAVILTGDLASHTLALDTLDTLLDPDASRDVPFYVLPFSADAVSVGTAYHARTLSGETCEEVNYLPAITDRALAVGTLADTSTQMIRRYSAIPLELTYNFTTSLANQFSASIPVLLGGFASAAKNTRLGTLHLLDIPPAPAGEPTISLSMKLDEDSAGDVILTARATLLHPDGTPSSNFDQVTLGNWFRFEDPDMEDVIAAERADDLIDHSFCPNPLYSKNAHFPADAVVRRDFADLSRFWPTRAAARDREDGNMARALCLYEKSLPYFPLGHDGITRSIRDLKRAFTPEQDDSPMLGADNPFLTPSRTGC